MDTLNSPVEQGVLALDVFVFTNQRGYGYDSDESDKKHDEPFCVFVHLERIEEGVELGAAFTFLNVTNALILRYRRRPLFLF